MPQLDPKPPWYIRLIRFKPEAHPVSYYKERLIVLAAASFIVTLYFGFVCLVIWKWSILTNLTNDLEINRWFIYEGAIFLAIVVLALIGSMDDDFVVAEVVLYSPSGYRSLFFLFVATLAFVGLLALPVYATGGAIDSPLSSTIVAMCGLAVLVSRSWYIRVAIVFACMVVYVYCMFGSPRIKITHENGHKTLHILSVLLTLGITLFLSWKGEFSIFKKGEKAGTESSKVANTDQLRGERNHVSGELEHEQKKSKEQRIIAGSKRGYIVTLFVFSFIASVIALFIIYKNFTPDDVNHVSLSSDIAIWVALFAAIVSAIGTLSTVILAWRSYRRDAREKELKIAQLERELAASNDKPALSAPEGKADHK